MQWDERLATHTEPSSKNESSKHHTSSAPRTPHAPQALNLRSLASQHSSGHSLRNALTGFAVAALTDLYVTVTAAITNVTPSAVRNIHEFKGT
jgi:hypothetical protein